MDNYVCISDLGFELGPHNKPTRYLLDNYFTLLYIKIIKKATKIKHCSKQTSLQIIVMLNTTAKTSVEKKVNK